MLTHQRNRAIESAAITESELLLKESLKGLRVLVTRPQPQADRLSSHLRQKHADTTVMPMVEITPLPVNICPEIADFSTFHKIIVISVPAVEIALGHKPANALNADWFTPGKGSAAALAQHGIYAFCPNSRFTSEAMLELSGLQDVQGQNILILKGEGGRDLLSSTLQRRGAAVTSLSLYRRLCPDYKQGQLDRTVAADGINAIVATSAQIISHLLACCSKPQIIMDIPILVPSLRIAEKASALGFKTVFTAPGASDTEIAGALPLLL